MNQPVPGASAPQPADPVPDPVPTPVRPVDTGREPARRLLIVNADDYGLTEATSKAIVQLHEDGVVTSTSALVLAPGFVPSSSMIAGHPTLGVGVHLCLVGIDPPVLGAAEIPTLVGRRGQLARSWHLLLPRLLARRIDLDDVRRELAAQIDLALSHGIVPSHLDSHQHLHLWPGISTVVLDLAGEYGIPAVRCPESRSYKAERPPVEVMSRRLRREIGEAGLLTTDRFAGLDESGKAVAARFDRVMRSVPDDITTFEFGVHPNAGYDPDRDRYAWGHRGLEEALGLSRPELPARLAAAGWTLGDFRDLSGAAASG